MPSSEARVGTERASRYLEQLCRHTRQMTRLPGHGRVSHADGERPPRIHRVDCSAGRGVIELENGRCELTADGTTLTLRVEADDEDALRRIRTLVGRRLETIGRRDGLAVGWTSSDGEHLPPGPAEPQATARHGRHALPITVMAVVALVLVGHVAVGDALADMSWTGWTVAAVGVVLVVKVALIAVGHPRLRRWLGARGTGGGEHG